MILPRPPRLYTRHDANAAAMRYHEDRGGAVGRPGERARDDAGHEPCRYRLLRQGETEATETTAT